MKITHDINGINGKQPESSQIQALYKNFGELRPGDSFSAIVRDIQPNRVLIEFDDGTTLSAKSHMLPDARIGDRAIFIVKENFNGQILLEMMKPDMGSPHAGIAREALIAADLPLTDENLSLVTGMIEHGLPIDAKTLTKAVFFRQAGPNLSLENIIFLINEDTPANIKTIDTLVAFLNGDMKLSSDMDAALGELSDTDAIVKKEIIETICRKIPGQNIRERIAAAFDSKNIPELKAALAESGINIDITFKKNSGELNSCYKNIRGFLSQLEEVSEKHALPQLRSTVQKALDNLEFSSRIQNYKEYMQLPFAAEFGKTEGELHVFKRSRGERLRDSASVLLALDMPNLGNISVLINKMNKSLQLQITAGNGKTLRLLSSEAAALTETLSEKGYTVSHILFKESQEKHDITYAGQKSEKLAEIKRYTFDMRV